MIQLRDKDVQQVVEMFTILVHNVNVGDSKKKVQGPHKLRQKESIEMDTGCFEVQMPRLKDQDKNNNHAI